MSDGERFLARWSRRKTESRVTEAPAAPSEPPAVAPNDARPVIVEATHADENEASQRQLPSLDSLRGIASDYRDFMRPDVDGGVRRAALRKLFADPHFNRTDGLDVYIDDYTKADPIPATMLAVIDAARRMAVKAIEAEGEQDPPRTPDDPPKDADERE